MGYRGCAFASKEKAVGEYMIGLVALNWVDPDQIRFSPASRYVESRP
jgi:hypothetical protein